MALSKTIKKLQKRWFVLRNVHAKEPTVLLHPRHTIAWMRGPMTRVELRRALGRGGEGAAGVPDP